MSRRDTYVITDTGLSHKPKDRADKDALALVFGVLFFVTWVVASLVGSVLLSVALWKMLLFLFVYRVVVGVIKFAFKMALDSTGRAGVGLHQQDRETSTNGVSYNR